MIVHMNPILRGALIAFVLVQTEKPATGTVYLAASHVLSYIVGTAVTF